MLVHIEKTPQTPGRPMTVRVDSAIGSAVVTWCGDPREADGPRYVEWTVDESVRWGRNTRPAALPAPGIRQEAALVVLRGRLSLTEDGAAVLELGDTHVLFDLDGPAPGGIDGTWVEVRVEPDRVSLYPYEL
ncbi:hypothetical protein ACFQ6N_36860 [Kitasatospora sp. NPDC056446]|uniref:hypothetical protein n=1 Tax=Kitasatospora sp. NPDC056446 TaxID=3345819 RepID=UPI00368BEDD8